MSMMYLKKVIAGLSFTLLCTVLFAQQSDGSDQWTTPYLSPKPYLIQSGDHKLASEPDIHLKNRFSLRHPQKDWFSQPSLSGYPEPSVDLGLNKDNSFFLANRRNRYSSLWAFTSLNYLYADLVGLMDKNTLSQYQTGTVNGIEITPGFLTTAAGFMQIPLANVFLPQVIKNERTLRWVQIASGTIMTLVQAGTLFVGEPTPYYVLFSAIEIGTTLYITLDAIKWKPKKNKR
jgi:hypothetical protein